MQTDRVVLSQHVVQYANQMAYASLVGTVDEIRAVVDCPPRVEEKDMLAIKYIQDYGTNLVNMRATSPRQRYSFSPQSPEHYSSYYPVYRASMDLIIKARKEDPDQLAERVDPLSSYVAKQAEYAIARSTSRETYSRGSSSDSVSRREEVKDRRSDWDCIVS